MDDPLNVCCVILAGGQSSRMGRDKALETIGAELMLHRMVRLANKTCLRTLVVGRPMPQDWQADGGELQAEFMEDAEPRFNGPMPAIRTALQAAGGEILVLACDMPLLSPALLRALHSAHRSRQDAWATIAATQGPDRKVLAEPMVAIYTPKIVQAFDDWIRHDRRSLQQCLELPDVQTWIVPDDLAPQLMNVNDPKALAQVRERLDSPQ